MPPLPNPTVPNAGRPGTLRLSVLLLVLAALPDYRLRSSVLVGLMLFLPWMDHDYRLPTLPIGKQWGVTVLLALMIGAVVVLHPELALAIITMLAFAALPEEWYFRGYLQQRLGGDWGAIFISSILFAGLHGLVRGPLIAALVFLPSLAFGWLYYRNRDFTQVVLLHTLSNVVFMVWVGPWLVPRLPPALLQP